VGKQYALDTNLKDVRRRLDEAFGQLSPATVQTSIDKSQRHLQIVWDQIQALNREDGVIYDFEGDLDEHLTESGQSGRESDDDGDVDGGE
jgi:hypothetical protein